MKAGPFSMYSAIGFALLLISGSSACQMSTKRSETTAMAVESPLYSLDEAVAHGVVDINYNPWTHRSIEPLTKHLAELGPGLINRVGFQYGGQSEKYLDAAGALVQHIRSAVPRALVGGGFNEAVYDSYHATLSCGGALGRQTFTADELASNERLGAKARLVDISKPRVQDYYNCVGQISIDKGITYLHFEAPGLVIHASSSQESAIDGYRRVQQSLRNYAAARHVSVYFSGNPLLAKSIKFEGIYVPSRFYHVTVPNLIPYQNKIAQPGIGVGYTYALSDRIVRDTVAETPSGTRVLFYVDNWDEQQDDLRRMMELDGQNRRTMFLRSAAAAHSGGVYFILPLEHCEGCVRPEHVGDPCELLPGGASEYDAYACGDWSTIKRALQVQK